MVINQAEQKHCCFIYRQQKEVFYEFAFNFYSSIDWGLLTNKYYAQLGKIKNMCSTLKGPAVKGKSPRLTKNDWTMVHIFCAAKWLCTCNRSLAGSRSSHYSHYCDESSVGGIQLHTLVRCPLYHVMMVLVCCVVWPLSVSLKTLSCFVFLKT